MDDFTDGSDEILKEFLIESHENLDQLDRDFVVLEQNPNDPDKLAAIFRCIHTIKGTCGFFAFEKLEAISHSGENLLSKLRDGEFSLTPEMTSALLRLVDAIRELLDDIETSGAEGKGDYSALVEEFAKLQEAATGAEGVDALGDEVVMPDDLPPEDNAPSEPVEAEQTADEAVPAAPVEEAPAEDAVEEQTPAPVTSEVEDETEAVEPQQLGKILVDEGAAEPKEIAEALQKQLEGDGRPLGAILVEDQGVEAEGVDQAVDKQQAQKAQAATTSLADSTIRVDVNLLDKLMNMVGELVLSRNQILQFSTNMDDTTFLTASQRLNLITSELQEGVMKTRMQPISAVWSKFPRVVRDLSQMVDKQIRIEMVGKDTELDKSILESIKDPLTHIVRNSVDHGIESSEDREKAGKPAEGCLLLRAYHEGGQVIIEIVDDGGGINTERVKAKAIERGLITPQQAEKMGRRELNNLVMLPGFSTAAKVTNISGRGVGMDVVKTNIEKIGGSIDLQSEMGKGTTLRIKIPLTLAIIPALVVTCGGARYAIPQVNLLELVRLEGSNIDEKIEMVHGSPVYRLRGNLLPLVYLNKALKISGNGRNGNGNETHPKNDGSEIIDVSAIEPQETELIADSEHKDSDGQPQDLNIVVLQAEDRQFGLIVETVHDTEEIVVKPLGKQLNGLSVFAGATIMGDGTVALILDVMGLAHTAHVISESGQQSSAILGRDHHHEGVSSDQQTILLFRCGEEGRMAIPLDAVARLEEFSLDTVENVGDMEVVQYRDDILPLIRISKVFNENGNSAPVHDDSENGHDESPLEAVVYHEDGKNVGLVVDNILDITDASLASKGQASREGIEFTAVVQGRVAEFVDIRNVIERAIPGFF